MDKEYKCETKGVVAEFEGKYWGRQHEDGHCLYCDFGPIEKAEIADPKYCVKSTDFTSKNNLSEYKQLEKATLRYVEVTTVYRVTGTKELKPCECGKGFKMKMEDGKLFCGYCGKEIEERLKPCMMNDQT